MIYHISINYISNYNESSTQHRRTKIKTEAIPTLISRTASEITAAINSNPSIQVATLSRSYLKSAVNFAISRHDCLKIVGFKTFIIFSYNFWFVTNFVVFRIQFILCHLTQTLLMIYNF